MLSFRLRLSLRFTGLSLVLLLVRLALPPVSRARNSKGQKECSHVKYSNSFHGVTSVAYVPCARYGRRRVDGLYLLRMSGFNARYLFVSQHGSSFRNACALSGGAKLLLY